MTTEARKNLNDASIGLALKEVLIKELTDFHHSLPPDPDQEPHELEIADINFYFDNSDILDCLKARAIAIDNNDWTKTRELNKKLTDLCKRDKAKLQRPLGAFVTFNDERSYNNMEANQKVTILGSRCRITKAPEPTNIIWENIGLDPKRRQIRIVFIILFTFLICVATFKMMKITANKQAYYVEKYDASLPCSALKDFYGVEKMSILAADEFHYSKLSEEADSNPDDNKMHTISSVLGCFCNAEKLKYPGDLFLSWTSNTFKTSDGHYVATCSDFYNDQYMAKLIGY